MGNLKSERRDKKKLDSIIKKKLIDAEQFLIVELNPDDPTLVDQLTLGEDWDNPFKLSRALDQHSAYYARWATLSKILKQKLQRLIDRRTVWESGIKKKIENKTFLQNKVKGMTANNAKPTGASVDYKFNTIYNKDNPEWREYNDPIHEMERQIDIVGIIVKAFESRKDMLVGMGHLVNKMLDKDLLIHKGFKKKMKERE